MLEVAIPASDHRGEVGNDPHQAVASGATCLFAYLVLEPLQALFPYPALSRFEPVTQKLEALSLYPAIPDVGLVGMQGEAVGFDPRFDFFQCRGHFHRFAQALAPPVFLASTFLPPFPRRDFAFRAFPAASSEFRLQGAPPSMMPVSRPLRLGLLFGLAVLRRL